MPPISGNGIWLDCGEHASHFYESSAEQKEVLLPFFRQGLENGEHCLYITSSQSVDDWYFELQAYGIDVQNERRRGALQVIHRNDWRLPGGFNSIMQARRTIHLIDRMRAGPVSLRIGFDAAWALDPQLPADQLCHWEATANLLYRDQAIRTICQYDLNEQPSAAVHAALRTHPVVIISGFTRPNPFYEAPQILKKEPRLNQSNADVSTVENMLAQLRAARV
jgi:hypothetical protein